MKSKFSLDVSRLTLKTEERWGQVVSFDENDTPKEIKWVMKKRILKNVGDNTGYIGRFDARQVRFTCTTGDADLSFSDGAKNVEKPVVTKRPKTKTTIENTTPEF